MGRYRYGAWCRLHPACFSAKANKTNKDAGGRTRGKTFSASARSIATSKGVYFSCWRSRVQQSAYQYAMGDGRPDTQNVLGTCAKAGRRYLSQSIPNTPYLRLYSTFRWRESAVGGSADGPQGLGHDPASLWSVDTGGGCLGRWQSHA